ncbi:hypothetical protein [Nannocystis pusilla]|uniref:Uncharacterized protein n=1 Tax=Nannocystis pusilla TaxID=889268 RepID=A0ABS7TVV3_9BACT|nr:hypothetical protein [Nannocystis pusilla]MBZ5712309.1 hypothetical protein [Nannocystis pusilla]
MTFARSFPLVLWTMVLAACPGDPATTTESTTEPPGDTPGTSTSTGETTEAPTTEVPTTGAPTTGDSTTTSTTGTTGDTTTTGGDGAITRVLYHPHVVINNAQAASAARYVEIVDGVAQPPVTLVDPGGLPLTRGEAVVDGRWAPYYTFGPEPPRLWAVDLDALAAHEVALPPDAERIALAKTSRDESHLIVWFAPQGSSDGADYQYYVCALGPAGECELAPVESAAGPATYIDDIHDISGTSGRIWYSTAEVDGPGRTELMGDVTAPADAITLAEFPDYDSGHFSFVSLDEKTVYFNLADGAETHAMDISADPPGPMVSLHPPLPGVRRRWSDDEKDLLLFVSDGLWGDLSHVAVDGASAGPMVDLNTGGPGHVYTKPLQLLPDRRVLILADIEAPMINHAYVLDIAEPDAPPLQPSGPLGPTGTVNDAFVRDDPAHVFYYAQETDQSPNELYRARLEPPGEPHKLNAPLPDGSYLLSGAFATSADGQRVIYAGSEVADRLDLFLVEFAGEAPGTPVNLTSGLQDEVHLLGRLGPDAAQAFFAVKDANNEFGALYMVPLSPEVGPPQAISAAGEQVQQYYLLPAK